MKKKVFLLFAVIIVNLSFGQNKNYWEVIKDDNISNENKFDRSVMPSVYHLYSLDFNRFKNELAKVNVSERDIMKSNVILSLPLADGSFEDFRFSDYAVMHPDLQKKYPDIRNYKAVSVNDNSKVVYLSVNIFGIHSITHIAGEAINYMDTYTRDLKSYIVYSRNHVVNLNPFQCHVEDEGDDLHNDRNGFQTKSSNGIFRTYRLALSSTIEYSSYHWNAAGVPGSASVETKKAAVLAAMVISVTRINSVYNKDLAVHLQLIANNDTLINITSDNFSNNNGGAMLEQNQAFVDSKIAWGDYDIGHVYSTGGGGVAILQSVCSGYKAMGVTGSNQPVNDPFNIDYVAHEMGHQFGATHTFNGLGSNCTTGARTNSTAVEPGSGTTIMAYAGICSPVNVQFNSDAYFHAVSMNQISVFVNGFGDCSENEVVTNTPPSIKPLKNYTIPKSTPFILDAIAIDNENDSMTYCWEQTNNNISTQPPLSTNANGPNFRSRTPITSSKRYFPALSNVVQNDLSPAYEVVPSVARTMSFALTVRDNNTSDYQQTIRGNNIITFANVGPFLVQSPNTNVTWTAGAGQTVTWDVAGTTANNINCNFVDIYLSTDGGQNFDTMLASKVPNDGSELVSLPNIPGTNNRIMVKGNNHIFYDISDENFSIQSPIFPTFAVKFNGIEGNQNINMCTGGQVIYPVVFEKVGAFIGTVNFSITGNPAGTTATLSQTSATGNGIVYVTISNTAGLAPGVYPMVLSGTSGTTTKSVNLYLEISSATFAVISNTAPADNTVISTTTPTLTWIADNTSTGFSYNVQIATDVNFSNIVEDSIVYTNNYTPSTLIENQDYFWRVAAKTESGCVNNYTTAFKFTTENLGVENITSDDFGFLVYPNPNIGIFNIEINNLQSDKVNICIYDVQGRVIYSKNYTANGDLKQEIDITHASAGIYLMSVEDGSNKSVKKIIIK